MAQIDPKDQGIRDKVAEVKGRSTNCANYDKPPGCSFVSSHVGPPDGGRHGIATSYGAAA